MEENISLKDLKRAASLARERELFEKTVLVVRGQRMSRRRVRKAKSRQDDYLFMKALVVSIETMCVLFVCFMGIFTFFELRDDSESSFYTAQLSFELTMLIIALAVVIFESWCIRSLLIIGFALFLLLNIFQILYFMLYNHHSPVCININILWSTFCVSSMLPIKHHSTFAAALLAIFHLALLLFAGAVSVSYQGTISEIVRDTDPRLVWEYARRERELERRRQRRRRRESRRRRRSTRERSRRSRRSRTSRSARSTRSARSSRSAVAAYEPSLRSSSERRGFPSSPRLSRYTKLDITKLPDGTRFRTNDNKGFNMEYYVEDGVFVGSGTETVSKKISICAPVRPRRRRRSEIEASPKQSIESTNSLMEQKPRDLQKQEAHDLS
ncbi:unnamed protein product [Cylicocyclus nassatus]|uniref:Uncharacterized protein n=1 Tax=Cylicocyclus nassatus TaxID=53992 RepID=A0AA36GUW6_CYLNA|nr:unnamed protein product [Cylicocyclus nassatus]